MPFAPLPLPQAPWLTPAPVQQLQGHGLLPSQDDGLFASVSARATPG